MKQLGINPWDSLESTLPIGTVVEGVVAKTTAFGAFVQLDNGIEALIHVTELSDQPFGKVEDVVQKGDRVTAKVIKLDPEHKKVALSIKDYLIEQHNRNRDDISVGSRKKKKSKKRNEDDEDDNE